MANKLYKFPNYKYFHIENMYYIDLDSDEQLHFQSFFDTGTPYNLQILYMYGSLDFCPKIDPFMPNLDILLNSISELSFFHSFEISESHLQTIMEASYFVQKLVIYWCKCIISSSFKLNPKLDYQIKHLDLFRTCVKDDSECLNKTTLPYFVKALSKTQLKQSLKLIHVKDDDYKGVEVQYLFNEHKFNLPVRGDDVYPMIKKTL